MNKKLIFGIALVGIAIYMVLQEQKNTPVKVNFAGNVGNRQ